MAQKLFAIRSRIALSVLLIVLPIAALLSTHDEVSRAQVPIGPNIMIILTDDQRGDWQSMRLLKKTREIFKDNGRYYPNAVATTPLCCPSRASIFSGQYAHNHGVFINNGNNFDTTHSIQYELQKLGYYTGFVGKYLSKVKTAPEYWSQWATMNDGGSYYNSRFKINGYREMSYYETNFVSNTAVDFLRGFETSDDRPWMLFVAPRAPHLPANPERKYRRAAIGRWERTPATRETDLSDKPPRVQRVKNKPKTIRQQRTTQLRSLLSVDDLVGNLFKTMANLNEQNTLAFFLSDNGYMWLEHGLKRKSYPYDGSVEIPFYVRWPGHIDEGTTDRRIVGNIDVAPTIYDSQVTGATPAYQVDGRSLFDPVKRDYIMVEYGGDDIVPYQGLWAPNETYVEYDDGFREYYGRNDPWELENPLGNDTVADDPPQTFQLGLMLMGYSDCVGPADCP